MRIQETLGKWRCEQRSVFYYRLVWGNNRHSCKVWYSGGTTGGPLALKSEVKGHKLKNEFSFGKKDTSFTKHFTSLVGISRYLSLIETEENGTVAELSRKRESDIMTHYFLHKVSTRGSLEGRVTGTGVHLGTCAVPTGQGSDWLSLQASLQLPSSQMALLPLARRHALLPPPSDRKHAKEPFPVVVLSRPVPAAPGPPGQWNPGDRRRRATATEMREPVLRGPAFGSGRRRASFTYPGKPRTLLS